MKYTVTFVGLMEGTEDTQCLKVHTKGNPDWKTTEVWYAEVFGRKRAWCCQCSSICAAMLGSCAHAKAVKRFMKALENPNPSKEKQ